MRPGYLVAFWLLVLGATSIRVDIGPTRTAEAAAASAASVWDEP